MQALKYTQTLDRSPSQLFPRSPSVKMFREHSPHVDILPCMAQGIVEIFIHNTQGASGISSSFKESRSSTHNQSYVSVLLLDQKEARTQISGHSSGSDVNSMMVIS